MSIHVAIALIGEWQKRWRWTRWAMGRWIVIEDSDGREIARIWTWASKVKS